MNDETMPLLIGPGEGLEGTPAALCAWASEHRRQLDQCLLQDGAVLLRGFQIESPTEFHDVAAAIRPVLRDYVGGDSPREALGDRVYTSTEFPPDMEIGLHNELSYTKAWPERVFFCCLVAASRGGETHFADGREVFRQMNSAVRDRFLEKGVIYQQHLRDGDGPPGPGKSWQETFDTPDPAAVERICRDQDTAWRWTGRGLRTWLRNPGVLSHPITAERCWFNQADIWHASFDTVKPQEHPGSAGAPTDEELGSHACYGDESEIPTADLRAVRAACKKSERLFSWQAGDLLILDNVLAMHGRKPFEGERRVLVAMA